MANKRYADYLNDLYDSWAIAASDEPDAPMVTSLHDGLDWVQVHAPRAFFEKLAQQVAEGDLEELHTWLTVWAMARKEPDPTRCGKPTKLGNPCHTVKPCRHHPATR